MIHCLYPIFDFIADRITKNLPNDVFVVEPDRIHDRVHIPDLETDADDTRVVRLM